LYGAGSGVGQANINIETAVIQGIFTNRFLELSDSEFTAAGFFHQNRKKAPPIVKGAIGCK
jgi:hypothetical protein